MSKLETVINLFMAAGSWTIVSLFKNSTQQAAAAAMSKIKMNKEQFFSSTGFVFFCLFFLF